MSAEHTRFEARRVVSGLDDRGRSTIVADGAAPTRMSAPAFTICDIWEVSGLPTEVLADDATAGEVRLTPPAGGLTYRVSTFPPGSGWDYTSGYQAALAAGGEAGSFRPGDVPGMHETDTVDILTVISGEMYAVLETTETLLRPGDSFVQRGTKHAWANRGSVPCTIATVQWAATRQAAAAPDGFGAPGSAP